MPNPQSQWKTLGILSFTMIVAWGSLYYAIAILAPDIQRELGWRAEVVFGAFSWSLLIAGLASTPAGMLIDRFGGRWVMSAGSLLSGAGLILLGMTHGVALYFAAWTLVGLGMALCLYEAAFATIIREFPHNARQGISTLTLFGGFASTVFWPLTLQLKTMIGWRETWMLYGVVHLLLCAPLHALLAGGRRRASVAAPAHADTARNYSLREALRDPAFWKLAFAFAANMFIFSALSMQLIPMLQQFGHPVATVVLLAALIGPMQVLGRIGEMRFARHTPPQTVGKLTFAALPAALLALLFLGAHQWAVAAFCVLYGLSNGILTIVRGTVPQAMFGRENYGAISGAMAGPGMIAKAAGPLAVAAIVELSPSPHLLLGALLAIALVSFGFYVAAVNAPRGVERGRTSRTDASMP
ncbi:MFS transporter [Noviherbaspirillum cavernae]|uniref:MFS transporter n=1 Tax=Noviherbaspirillum cavernae TaxID=2320862 RepID=A0A418X5K3_9BURK|nr:MFS transporter [Noviherbaspirillum cavernae]RJG07666.1 MFS transporter [Noviherbaspirillum cavernae]